jgi:hypothetical protein
VYSSSASHHVWSYDYFDDASTTTTNISLEDAENKNSQKKGLDIGNREIVRVARW